MSTTSPDFKTKTYPGWSVVLLSAQTRPQEIVVYLSGTKQIWLVGTATTLSNEWMLKNAGLSPSLGICRIFCFLLMLMGFTHA